MEVSNVSLSKVEIVTNAVKTEALVHEMGKYGISGMTIYEAKGCGVQLGTAEYVAEKSTEPTLLEKQVIMIVLPTEQLDAFLDFVEKELYTGHIGDGKIFISQVNNVVRVRTGEAGIDALNEAKD